MTSTSTAKSLSFTIPSKNNLGRRSSRIKRRDSTGSASLASFGSEHNNNDQVVQLGNISFLSDDDLPDGQSAVLGIGSFATVRLARRRIVNTRRLSTMSEGSTTDEKADVMAHKNNNNNNTYELVAVKIIQKSILNQCHSMERDDQHQLQVHTALENVEREIAVMKMIQHPNLVSLHEVIDIPDSDRLYMVIDYLPLGEIMTHQEGTNIFRRRPRKDDALEGVTVDGHFDEYHAALFFCDVMHALGYLHSQSICHRDLKPENILVDFRGVAKISDFGVAHLFEDELPHDRASFTSMETLVGDGTHPSRKVLSRKQSDAAANMHSMSDKGHLTKTEGTWCFWSPEMCAENSLVFSGYACDIWAAGVCLHIFATGKLPFYSDIPLRLFDMIADAKVDLDSAGLSDVLVDLLRKVLAKDPFVRASVGDCLSHPFCAKAREDRIRTLGEDALIHKEITVNEEDLQHAFSDAKILSVRGFVRHINKSFQTMRKRLGSFSTQQSDIEAELGSDDPVKKHSKMIAPSKSSGLEERRNRWTIGLRKWNSESKVGS